MCRMPAKNPDKKGAASRQKILTKSAGKKCAASRQKMCRVPAKNVQSAGTKNRNQKAFAQKKIKTKGERQQAWVI